MQLFAWHYPSAGDLADPTIVTQTFAKLARLRASGLYLMAPEGAVLDAPEPLQQFLARAEDLGIEVHLGLEPFSEPPQVTVEMGRRRYRYGQNGDMKTEGLCPAWPENRILALNRARTLLETFNPVGLHLDYVRYRFANSPDFTPDLEWSEDSRWTETYCRCQCPLCQSERLQLLGREANAWDERHPGYQFKLLAHRDETIRSFVRQMKELCAQSHTRLSVAARVQYLNRALIEGQDWVRWAEKGLVDVISPMNYSPDPAVVRRRLEDNLRRVGHTAITILEGLGRRSSAGEATPEQLAEQVRVVCEAGLPGVAIFTLEALTDRDYDLLAEFV